jgi:hypothetical protein
MIFRPKLNDILSRLLPAHAYDKNHRPQCIKMIIVISTGNHEVYFYFHEPAENLRDVASAPSNNILSHRHTVLWSRAVSSFALWPADCHCAHATMQKTGALSVAS